MDPNNINGNDFNTFNPVSTLSQTGMADYNNMDPNMLGPLLHGLADLMRAYTEGCRQMFEMGHQLGMEMAQNGCSMPSQEEFDQLFMKAPDEHQPPVELSE